LESISNQGLRSLLLNFCLFIIAEKVTNWTHGDRSMRIELPVGVNYGTSPKKAINVLEATARAHPEVLREPAPQVIFVGFGDSSINLELRAWTDEFAYAR
jgi:potassium-dependent mechanosensitive channel